MKYQRMPIEIESPEEQGYETISFNLSESSMRDRRLSDLGLALEDLLLAYGPHRGSPSLRALIAAQAGSGIEEDDVLTTAGGSGALFIVATTLLEKRDHMIVVRPNYATNIETPRAIGCSVTTLDLKFEEGFWLDPERLQKQILPHTKLISITTPHNPTGAIIDDVDLKRIVAIAERRGIRLLVDETYRDMLFLPKPPVAASLSPLAVSVSSMSKTYGIPGVRVGWLLSRDAKLMEKFLAAKEQIGICGSIIDERIAEAALAKSQAWLGRVRQDLSAAVATVEAWIKREKRMEWVRPLGGCVCFPRIRADAQIDIAEFYRVLLKEQKTLVGAGHWFEMDDRYMRIGFGWPLPDELSGGLGAISRSLDAAQGS